MFGAPVDRSSPSDAQLRAHPACQLSASGGQTLLKSLAEDEVIADARAVEIYEDILSPRVTEIRAFVEPAASRCDSQSDHKDCPIGDNCFGWADERLLPPHMGNILAAIGGFRGISDLAEAATSVSKYSAEDPRPSIVSPTSIYFRIG
jgi:hypothetical protein